MPITNNVIDGDTFNSPNPGDNDTTRTAWLDAIGIGAPEHLVDFETGFVTFVGGGTANISFETTSTGGNSADFDSSGVVGFSDLQSLLTAWGPCVSCPQDLTGDGGVGFADLLALLNAWGACSS